MALNESVMNVPLTALDEHVPKTAGPVGALSRLLDAQVVKFQGAPGAPPNAVRVDKRDAFLTFSDVVRSSVDGTVQGGATLANQTLLKEFGGQELLVANDKTHVFSGVTAAWQRHDYQLPTFALSQGYVHTSNSLAIVPDVAQAQGVDCNTWVTKADHNAGGGTPTELAGCYFRVVDAEGVVLRADTRINATDTRVKCVGDGAHFWIFSEKGDGTGNVTVTLLDTKGVTLATATTAVTYAAGDFWDVTVASWGPTLAQATGGNMQFTKYSWNGAVIAQTSVVDNSIAGVHRIGWLTNDSGDAFGYLSAIEHVGANNNTVRVYRVPSTLVNNHAYTIANTVADEPCNVTGYVMNGASDITVAWALLDPTGAQYLNNSITIYSCTFAGALVNIATIYSMNLASRAFKLGQSYYAVGYYPSNLAVVSATETLPNQPTYFLLPLSNATQRTCGRFEYASAYCDWQAPASKYNFALASVVSAAPFVGMTTALSYRAESFTSSNLTEGRSGISHFNPFVVTSQATTVGVKSFNFGDPGEAVELASELLLPGPLAATWSGGEFSEHGVALAFEQPTVSSVPTGGVPVALTPGTYQYVVVGEWTDTNGKRVRSLPSPPATVVIAAGHYASLTGFMNHATNKKDLLISIYRTDMVPDSGGGFVTTTLHYKITLDAPTATDAPLYNDNAVATWSYADSNLNITANEILYTDKNQLANYPAPPFSKGCVWRDRVFLVGYDNAVWFSAEPTEGDALWFHPAFRMVVPTNQRITAIAATTEGYLLVLCERSAWYFPAVTFPDAAGKNGSIPNAVELKFNMGCTGHALVTKLGLVYSSSSGGLWLITRDLQNTWFSEQLSDTLGGGPVTALAVDSRQRIYAYSAPTIGVFDLVANCWYEWRPPAPVVLFSTFLGTLTFGDGSLVWFQNQGSYVDKKTVAGVTMLLPYFHSAKLNSIHFGGVRNFASLLEMQLIGDTHTASAVTLDLAFDDDPTIVESETWTTDPSAPFAYSYGPANQLCSGVEITVTESLAPGQVAGQGFSLELIALTVGLYGGQNRLPDASRV